MIILVNRFFAYTLGALSVSSPCPYLFKNSIDVLKKKTKKIDIFYMDKKCFIKKYRIKSSTKNNGD